MQADIGLVHTVSWLVEFSIRHVVQGCDVVSQTFLSTSQVAAGGALPLMHRAVRSGSAQAVRMLFALAEAHGLQVNMGHMAGAPVSSGRKAPALVPLGMHACMQPPRHVLC